MRSRRHRIKKVEVYIEGKPFKGPWWAVFTPKPHARQERRRERQPPQRVPGGGGEIVAPPAIGGWRSRYLAEAVKYIDSLKRKLEPIAYLSKHKEALGLLDEHLGLLKDALDSARSESEASRIVSAWSLAANDLYYAVNDILVQDVPVTERGDGCYESGVLSSGGVCYKYVICPFEKGGVALGLRPTRITIQCPVTVNRSELIANVNRHLSDWINKIKAEHEVTAGSKIQYDVLSTIFNTLKQYAEIAIKKASDDEVMDIYNKILANMDKVGVALDTVWIRGKTTFEAGAGNCPYIARVTLQEPLTSTKSKMLVEICSDRLLGFTAVTMPAPET